MILSSSYWLRLKRLILACHLPVQCKHSWPWDNVCSQVFLGGHMERQSHQPHTPGSVSGRKKWNTAAGPLLVTACGYLVLFCFQVQNIQHKPRISFQLADAWPLVALGQKATIPGCKTALLMALDVQVSEKERFFSFIFSLGRLNQTQLLCYSLSL